MDNYRNRTHKLPNGSTYIGYLKDGKPNGKGVLKYDDGKIFKGIFNDGKLNGLGEQEYSNGHKFIGKFEDGVRSGYGIYCFPSGRQHIGEFREDRLNGFGTVITANGLKERGEFKDGKKHGRVAIIMKGKKTIGEYINDVLFTPLVILYNDGVNEIPSLRGVVSQYGVLTTPDGRKYIGDYDKDGVGILLMPNGRKYVGDFKNGLPNGTGTETYPDGRKYSGCFKDGQRCGKGVLHFQGSNNITYVGYFKNDIPEGKGVFFQEDWSVTSHNMTEGVFSDYFTKLKSTYSNEEKLTNVDNLKTYYLFFDTETTGIPKNFKAPITDTDNWPRLVQLAFLCYDINGAKISSGNFIIKPDGFVIPEKASNIHGISTALANKQGKSLTEVLKYFASLVKKAVCIVAHNVSFDSKIIGAEFLRCGMKDIFKDKQKICTMERSVNFCKIKGVYGFKYPTLTELHYKLFNEDFQDKHNATSDIVATAKCFWELKRREII